MRRVHARLAVVTSLGIACILAVTTGMTADAVGPGQGPERQGRHRPDTLVIETKLSSTDPPAPRLVVTPAQPLRVLLLGDSLAVEAQGPFIGAVTATGRAQVDTMVYGGTAICDWLPRLEEKLQSFRPQAAVVEFSGNLLTPCMVDPATGGPYVDDAYLAKYRADAATAMDLFTRYDVAAYWANAPISRTATHANPIAAIYASLPAQWPNAHYVDAGRAVLDRGTYTDYLPCLPLDPCTDVDPVTGQPAAVVRAPDGGHFCPGAPAARRGVTEECPVWSSGAWRYGNAMARSVIADYGL